MTSPTAVFTTGMHEAGLWGEVGHTRMQCVCWSTVAGLQGQELRCVGSTLYIWRSRAR